MSPDRAAAERAITVFAEKYGGKYPKIADCLTKNRTALLAFYDFLPSVGRTCPRANRCSVKFAHGMEVKDATEITAAWSSRHPLSTIARGMTHEADALSIRLICLCGGSTPEAADVLVHLLRVCCRHERPCSTENSAGGAVTINLRTVPACRACNTGWSKDEEYMAVVLAHISPHSDLTAKLEPGGKIDRALSASPGLDGCVVNALVLGNDGQVWFQSDLLRIGRITTKLAYGLYCLRYGQGAAPTDFSSHWFSGPGVESRSGAMVVARHPPQALDDGSEGCV